MPFPYRFTLATDYKTRIIMINPESTDVSDRFSISNINISYGDKRNELIIRLETKKGKKSEVFGKLIDNFNKINCDNKALAFQRDDFSYHINLYAFELSNAECNQIVQDFIDSFFVCISLTKKFKADLITTINKIGFDISLNEQKILDKGKASQIGVFGNSSEKEKVFEEQVKRTAP